VVKQFRAALTKKLLSTNHNSVIGSNGFKYDQSQFPQLIPSQNSSTISNNGDILSKLNVLMENVGKINENITKLTKRNEQAEKFMLEKIDSDKMIIQDIVMLKNNDKILETNQVQHELKLKRHDNILSKLLIPIFDEMAKVILSLNNDQQGRTLDPGLKTDFEIIRAQLKLALDGKDY
jgi:hypothetical protein